MKLQANIQRRFSDRLLSVEKNNGQIIIRRRATDDQHRYFDILKVPTDASRDYILLRLYEMDTWSQTMAREDLSLDETEKFADFYERAKSDRQRNIQERLAWHSRRR